MDWRSVASVVFQEMKRPLWWPLPGVLIHLYVLLSSESVWTVRVTVSSRGMSTATMLAAHGVLWSVALCAGLYCLLEFATEWVVAALMRSVPDSEFTRQATVWVLRLILLLILYANAHRYLVTYT